MRTSGLLACGALGSVLLGACSGGGGNGLSDTTAAITPDNATEVAKSMSMSLQVIDAQEMTSFETMTAEGAGTEACPDGGLATAGFQVDLPPIGEVSSGDVFFVEFDGCSFGLLQLDGRITYALATLTGDPQVDDEWEVDLTLDVDALTASAGDAQSSLDGSWSMAASQNGDDTAFSLLGDFTLHVDDGETEATAELEGLLLTCDYDAAAGESTYSVEGSFASSQLGGAVTVTTDVPLVLVDGDLYPSEGELFATGANDSTLRFTVLDAESVRLEVDEDGDGDVDFDVVADWDAL